MLCWRLLRKGAFQRSLNSHGFSSVSGYLSVCLSVCLLLYFLSLRIFLASMSKIFEKLIMQRITEIGDLNNIDLTGVNQHGFKRKQSTSTAGLEIQSEIARALDSNKYSIMASLDLSSAFDIVILLQNKMQKIITIITFNMQIKMYQYPIW